MKVASWFSSIVLLAALWLLGACAPSGPTPTTTPAATPTVLPTATRDGTNLPFETIERGGSCYDDFANSQERVVLIRSLEEISRLSGQKVREETEIALAQLDYGRYFVLALFRGRFASSGYDVIIQQVSRRNGELVIRVQLWAPSPYYAVTAAVTCPYHIVKVTHDDGILEEASVVLESQTVTPTPPVEIRRLTPGSNP